MSRSWFVVLRWPLGEHARLQASVAVWDIEIRSFQSGSVDQPAISSGLETVEVLGEHWIVFDQVHESVDSGQQHHGHTMYGDDPASKKYVGTWCESGSPSPSTCDAANTKIAFNMLYQDLPGILGNSRSVCVKSICKRVAFPDNFQ